MDEFKTKEIGYPIKAVIRATSDHKNELGSFCIIVNENEEIGVGYRPPGYLVIHIVDGAAPRAYDKYREMVSDDLDYSVGYSGPNVVSNAVLSAQRIDMGAVFTEERRQFFKDQPEIISVEDVVNGVVIEVATTKDLEAVKARDHDQNVVEIGPRRLFSSQEIFSIMKSREARYYTDAEFRSLVEDRLA